jgi:hypothetical protein
MNRVRLTHIVLLVVALICSEETLARGGRSRGSVGIYFGSPLWGSPFWPYYGSFYPYYYPPMTVPVPVPTEPPTYIEQDETAGRLPANYWYYCSDPPGYYPTVTDCPVGWQQVPPR